VKKSTFTSGKNFRKLPNFVQDKIFPFIQIKGATLICSKEIGRFSSHQKFGLEISRTKKGRDRSFFLRSKKNLSRTSRSKIKISSHSVPSSPKTANEK
jgi:hypothetical protein